MPLRQPPAPCVVAATPARRRVSVAALVAASLGLLLASAATVFAQEQPPAGAAAAATAGAPDATEPTPPPAPLPPPAPAEPPAPALFYFYSPDWRPPDLGRLASAVETSLANGGVRTTFQAFTRYEDFERHLADKAPVFLIAPAWIAKAAAGSRLGLTVVVRPQRRGRTGYRKALMSRPGIDSIDGLARGSVAATLHATSDGAAASVLSPFNLDPNSARVVPVPKDVDALLALSFGQVDGALVTSEQYDQLALSNPAEASRLRVLAFSPEVPLPPVFASAGADPQATARLRERLLHLAEDPDGASALALLGFDGFVADLPPPPKAAAAPPPRAAAAPTPSAKPPRAPAKPARTARPPAKAR